MLIKKSGTYDTSNRLYGRKREKVWIFEGQLQKWGWETMSYPSKNPIFPLKTFFHWLWESFLCVVWLRSNYLRDCLNIVLYVGKKIRNIRHVKQIIWQETWKSLDFWRSTSKMGLRSYGISFQKPHFFHSKLFFNGSEKLFCTSYDYVQVIWEIV